MSGSMAEKAARNFIEAYEAARTALPGADGWLARRRAVAIEAFAGAGLPHRRLEEWKYTDLRQTLDKAACAPAPEHKGAVVLPETAAASAFSALDRHVLVFMNGRYRADLSKAAHLPKGVELRGLADVL